MKKSMIIGLTCATVLALPILVGIIIDSILVKIIGIFFLVFLVCSFGVFYEEEEKLKKEIKKLNNPSKQSLLRQKKLATKKKWKQKK